MAEQTYKVRQYINGEVRTGTAPGGTHIAIGATAVGDGDDTRPIVMIDWGSGYFCREGEAPAPFPVNWYKTSDIVWDDDPGDE